jgi:hypothetical protein
MFRRRVERSAAVGPCAEPLESRALLAAVDPTLAAWFRADALAAPAGAAVGLWADASGHGFNATQPDPARRPTFQPGVLNGRAALHFDGADQTQLSFARPVSGGFTMFVVFSSRRGAGEGDAWYGGAGLVDGDVPGVTSDFGLSLNADGQVLAGTGAPDTFLSSGLGFDDGRAHVAAFVRVGTTGEIQLYVDGRLFERSTGTTQPLTAPSTLSIGAARTGGEFFTGDVGEIRVYSVAMGAAARTGVEASLLSAYNVAPAPADWFANPVAAANFPDPGAIEVDGTYYAFATNGNNRNVQAMRSADLVHWTTLPDALPALPSWARAGRTWAPDVLETAAGQYVLYYTAWSVATDRQAIGVATASGPAGPFTPAGTGPLVSQANLGGAIDPSVFTDADGAHYLLWKNDGNAIGTDTFLYAQRLSPDGLSLLGSPAPLIHQDQPWEGSLVEAPVMWAHGGTYYLFYSANFFGDGSYATGYAVADSLFGPYTKPADPFLHSEPGVIGPGGPEIVLGPDGDPWMLYHTWNAALTSRNLDADNLEWDGDVPVLRGPSRVPQPVPQRPKVAGRWAFYNDSAFDGGSPAASFADDGAIATDKAALPPGGAATFANVTSDDKGLNGVFVDVAHLPRAYAPAASDFAFRTGPTPATAGTSPAPAPTSITVRRGAGVNGSDRITFAWAAGAVRNAFLQVTVLANDHTAQPASDVFTFGNRVGEAGDRTDDWTVTAADYVRTRAALGNAPVPVTSPFDFNRDGRVNARDLAIVRAAQPRAAVAVAAESQGLGVATVTRAPLRRRDAWQELLS